MPITITARSIQAPTMLSRAEAPIRLSNSSNRTTPTTTNGADTPLGAVVVLVPVLAIIMASGVVMATITETGILSPSRVPPITPAMGGGAGVSFVKLDCKDICNFIIVSKNTYL